MLPSILHVAEEYNLVINPRTYEKKEAMCKCPFCNEDKNEGKYFLSLNTEKNLFKCWYCKESGGVLQFESLLSGKPFQEIRMKYFGKSKKNLHPAYRLSPDQLKKIGWQDKKRSNFKSFKENRDKVLLDWKIFEFEELVKFYALFTLIGKFPIEKQRKDHYKWFLQICKESKVEDISGKIIVTYKSKRKKKWVLEGERIADLALKHCYKIGDYEFVNLFVNVLFVIETLKIIKKSEQNTAV